MATAEPSVTGIDHRQLGRDSLLLMAEVRLAGGAGAEGGTGGEHRVKVRNLSAGGMMAEGPMKVARGTQVEVNLRNIGWAEGVVAWIQDNRFGIAFIDEIDPKLARAPVGQGDSTPRFVKPAFPTYNTGPLRKI